MKFVIVVVMLFVSLILTAEVVNYSDLPPIIQKRVIPDLDGKVLIDNLADLHKEEQQTFRELPTIADGWPVSYSSSNCHNGAIYENMDEDAEQEILFGVGTQITALNVDGTPVTGWPVSLNYYIWGSPASGDIDGDGEVEIVCTSRNNTNANSGELYAFELDGTSCSGFPIVQAGGGTNNACLYDLDSDGAMEILVNIRNHPQGWVYVYNGDGTIWEGFPQELDYIPGAGISTGDITGDDIPEIIALSYNKLHVFDLDGNLLPGFPLENPGYNYSYSQPILHDLDNDELPEIIWGGCSASAGAVFAVNEDASSVAGWPQSTGQWIFGTVAIGDLDQDGAMDIVVGDQVSSGTPTDYIYAWDAGGNALEGFPAGPTNAIYAQIGIADIDGDDNVELMIDDNNFGFGYNAYNHDGTQCAEWPLPCGTVWSSTTMQITPVFGDVDNDGQLEILGAATDIMGWVVECYLWDTDTTWNEELAYMKMDGVNPQHNGFYEAETSPFFPPPENVDVDYTTATLSWTAPITDELTGYNVYLDGIFQEFTTELSYTYEGLIPEEPYLAGVSAVYDEPGESEIIEVGFIYLPNDIFEPPRNLEVEHTYVAPDNYYELSWDEPFPGLGILVSYRIYVNDEEYETIGYGQQELTILDAPTNGNGECVFYVTALYEDPTGESIPSNSVTCCAFVSAQDELVHKKQISIFPNPFQNSTTIFMNISSDPGMHQGKQNEQYELEIYNIKGQRIRVLECINCIDATSSYQVIWDGRDSGNKEVASGIYYLKLMDGNEQIQVTKVVKVK